MKRRTLLAATAFSALLGLAPWQARAYSPTADDQADLTRIETYLNGIHNLHANFRQIAPDGGQSTGSVWISRPGRMRFQYDPPSPLLLVAGSGLVVFHDEQLQQTNNIPLSRTPLGILLADNISLSGAVTVTSLARQPGTISVTLYRTATPGDGTLNLTFADNPLQLKQWTVVDSRRRATQVLLGNPVLGGTFDDRLFHYIDPKVFQK